MSAPAGVGSGLLGKEPGHVAAQRASPAALGSVWGDPAVAGPDHADSCRLLGSGRLPAAELQPTAVVSALPSLVLFPAAAGLVYERRLIGSSSIIVAYPNEL